MLRYLELWAEDPLFYSIIFLLIAITYLLLYSSPLVAIISSYVLIKKIDYSTKEGNMAALFIILLNFPPILLTLIGEMLYSLKFFLQNDKLNEWGNGTGTLLIGISILMPFVVLFLYILLYIKTKIVNHYLRKKEWNLIMNIIKNRFNKKYRRKYGSK